MNRKIATGKRFDRLSCRHCHQKSNSSLLEKRKTQVLKMIIRVQESSLCCDIDARPGGNVSDLILKIIIQDSGLVL